MDFFLCDGTAPGGRYHRWSLYFHNSHSEVTPFPTNTPAPTPETVDVNQLFANPWVLVGYGDTANPTVIEKGVVITLEFTTDGQLAGFGGCNNYSGSFQAATDGTMTISALATTLMACPTGMDLESVYLSALQSARSFNFGSQGRQSAYSDPSQPDQVLVYTSSAKPLTDTIGCWFPMGIRPPPRQYLQIR